ncbi:hypothetical protein K1W54_42595 [Micromonospora sp. CPCC 205371]|nr:hypothetical protein [Micromonospora sp. CPCC 205371]
MTARAAVTRSSTGLVVGAGLETSRRRGAGTELVTFWLVAAGKAGMRRPVAGMVRATWWPAVGPVLTRSSTGLAAGMAPVTF